MSKRIMAAVVGLMLIGGSVARAEDRIWEGTESSEFADQANWYDGFAPNVDEIAEFSVPGIGVNQPRLLDDYTLGGLRFLAAGWTLSADAGKLLTLNSTGISSAGIGTNAISANLAIGADSLFTVGVGNRLSISGSIAGAGYSLTKAGAGTLLLSGVNTFGGAGKSLSITGGTVSVTRDASLGAAGTSLALSSGGTLAVGSGFWTARAVEIGAGGANINVARNQVVNLTGTLTGSATLTKTGFGNLWITGDGSGFTGQLVINNRSPLAGRSDVTTLGTIDHGSVVLRGNGVLNASGITIGLANTLLLDNRFGNLANRIPDATPISLAGGVLNFQGSDSANSSETLGVVTLSGGHSRIIASRGSSTSFGADLTLSGLASSDGSTVEFATSAGTLGSTGGNPRIYITGATVGTTLPGWARIGSAPVAYTANGVAQVTSFETSTNMANWTAGKNVSVASVTAAVDATPWSLTVSGNLDLGGKTLNLEGGGLYISGNGRSITNGVLTAGGTAGPGTVTDLVYYCAASSSGATTLSAQITDNPNGGAVRLVTGSLFHSDQGAPTLAYAGDNTYSGGTVVNGGVLLTGTTAGRLYLGTGSVLVRGGGYLNLRAVGATSYVGTGGTDMAYSVMNAGYINLADASYSSSNETFYVAAGGVLRGTSTALGSLSRDGNVTLDAGAIVGHNTNSATTIKDLGTEADLFFGINTGYSTALTIGTGTAWMGVSTAGNSGQTFSGSITANSDYILQGLAGNNSGTGTGATLSITGDLLSSGARRNVTVLGQVTLAAAAGKSFAGVDTFTVTDGAQLNLTAANALGATAQALGVEVLSGGTLNPSNATAINAPVIVRAGGVINASVATTGLTGTAAITLDLGAIVNVTTGGGLVGSQLPAQALSAGHVLRLSSDSPTNIAVANLANIVVTGGNRTLTANANFITVIDPTAPAGFFSGVITNDGASRTLNNSTNSLIIGPTGGILAASTGTTFTIAEEFRLNANTLYIGTGSGLDVIDGQAKGGIVSLTSAINTAAPGSRVVVRNGAVLLGGAADVIPDITVLEVQAGGAFNIGGAETLGSLQGGGLVTNLTTSLTLTIGADDADATFSGTMTAATPANLSLIKIGAGTQTFSGTLSYAGTTTILAGGLTLANAGTFAGTTGAITVREGALLTLSNTAANQNNRLAGRAVSLSGGSLILTGNAGVATSETMGTLSLGRSSLLTLVPHQDQALTLTAASMARAGGDAMLVVAPQLGLNAPGTTAGAANVMFTAAPALFGRGTGASALPSLGTEQAQMLPYVVVNDGTGLGFATYDSAVGTTGLRKLTAAEINSTANSVNSGSFNNVLVSNEQFISATTTINSLTLSGIASINSTGGQRQLDIGNTYNSGQYAGILVLPGSNAVINANVYSGYREILVHGYGDLAINGNITGDNLGFITKAGPGELTLNGSFSNSIALHSGRITLGPDAVRVGSASLYLYGGVLDVNGKSIIVSGSYGGLLSNTSIVGSEITNSGAMATLTVRNDNGATFGGIITGNLNLDIQHTNGTNGSGTLTWGGGQFSYTGTTTFSYNGGTLFLANYAALPQTSQQVTIKGGTLRLDNTGYAYLASRIGDDAPVALHAATIDYRGRTGVAAVEDAGAVTVHSGRSGIVATAYSGGTATLNLADLTRDSNSRGVIAIGSSGGDGHGVKIATFSETDLLAPWIVWSTSAGSPTGIDFARYTADGVRAVVYNSTGADTAWTGSTIANPSSAANATLSADRTIQALKVSGITAAQGSFNLNLISGGLLFTGAAGISGTGRLTAGGNNSAGAELLINHATDDNNRTIAIAPRITDNPGTDGTFGNADDGSVSVTFTGRSSGRTTYRLDNLTNSYTGLTTVQSSTLTFAATANTVFVPGNIVIAHDGVVRLAANNQLASNATVTMLGHGQLNLNNFNQTLGQLVFVNSEAIGQNWHVPNVSTGTGTLTVGSIIAENQNLTAPSQLNGLLGVAAGGLSVTINGSPNVTGLTINATVSGDGVITKLGNGALLLNGNNSSFSGGVNLQAGVLRIGHANALGTSAFTLAGATVTASGTSAVVTSTPITLGNGGIIGATSGFTGALTFGAATIAADASFATNVGTTFAGASSIGGNLTVTGNGALTFSAAATTVSGDRTLTFNNLGATTFSGGLVIGGNSVIGGSSAKSITGGLTLNDNLTLTGNGNVTVGSTGTVSVTGNRLLTVNSTGTNTFSAPVALGGNLTLAGTGNLSITGLISGTGDLIKQSSNTVTLSNNSSSFVGTVQVSEGALRISNPGSTGNMNQFGNAANPILMDGGTLILSADNTGGYQTYTLAATRTITAVAGKTSYIQIAASDTRNGIRIESQLTGSGTVIFTRGATTVDVVLANNTNDIASIGIDGARVTTNQASLGSATGTFSFGTGTLVNNNGGDLTIAHPNVTLLGGTAAFMTNTRYAGTTLTGDVLLQDNATIEARISGGGWDETFVVLSGNISDGGAGKSLNLSSGNPSRTDGFSQTITLAGNNSFSGGSVLSAYNQNGLGGNTLWVRATNTNALGTGLVTMNVNTHLTGNTGTHSLANDFLLNANVTFGDAAMGTGTLNVGGNIRFSGSYTLTKNAGQGNFVVAGKISPGLGTATFNTVSSGFSVTGGYEWTLGSLTDAGLGGVAGTNWSLITITGAGKVLTFDGAAVTLAAGSVLPSADAFWQEARSWTIGAAVSGGAFALNNGSFTINNSAWLSFGVFFTSADSENIVLTWLPYEANNSRIWVGVDPGASHPSVALGETTSVTQAFGRVMQGSVLSTTIAVGSDGLDAATTNASVITTGAAVTTTANPTLIETLTADGVNVGLNTATLGVRNGAVILHNLASGSTGPGLGTDNGDAIINVTGTVLADRVITADTIDLVGGGLLRVGQVIKASTFLRTAGSNDEYTAVKVAAQSGFGWSLGAGFNPMFNDGNVVDSRVVSFIITSGGDFTVTPATAFSALPGVEAGVSGEQAPVAIDVKYNALVYSGVSRWVSDGDSAWGAMENGNWADAVTPSIHIAPGTWPGYDDLDTAMFDGAGTQSLVLLGGTSVSLKSLSLSGTTSYTIAQGDGTGVMSFRSNLSVASLDVSGIHTITAPINLSSPLAISVQGLEDHVYLSNVNSFGSAVIVKDGSGSVSFDGSFAITATGTINVNAGRVDMNTKVGTENLTVNIANGAEAYFGVSQQIQALDVAADGSVMIEDWLWVGHLSGTGTLLSGTVAVLDTLSPGQGVGRLTANFVEFQDRSAMIVELLDDEQFDKLVVVEGLRLDGDVRLEVRLWYDPVLPISYLIINNLGSDPINGLFLNLAEGEHFTLLSATGRSYLSHITYQGGDGNDVVLTVVPEPATLSLLVLGAIGYAVARRSRRQ